MALKSAQLCIMVPLLLAAAGCDPGDSKRPGQIALDCGHRDRAICTMVNLIGSRRPELPGQASQLPYSELVALDVAAILRGTQTPNVHSNADLRHTMP